MSFIQFFSCVQFHSLASWNGIFCLLMGLRFWRFYNRTAKEKKRNFDFQPVGRFSPEESSGLVEKVFARILASVGCVRGWEIESNWNFGELFRVFLQIKIVLKRDFGIEVPKPQPFKKKGGGMWGFSFHTVACPQVWYLS